ncbi:hypothetical protein KBC04_04160 [Candidatus Babeliales bacterium]|nr:hypothetical protein [Candidatus Babeliales bacterium]MBP9843309.1 hypothetical protein [Candidatus Babeliales bacterium]
MKICKKITKNLLVALIFVLCHHQNIDGCDQKQEPQKSFNASQKLMELASAHILSRAIHVAAMIKVADHLVDGPCNVYELAEKTEVHPTALYRLLRLLASNNIFYETADQGFALTPLAELLISNHPESLQPWLANHDGDEKRWRSYGHMGYSVQTGNPAFNYVYGQGYFDFIAQDNDMAASFDEGMRNLSEKEDRALATYYDFSAYNVITDIGGGKGGLLTEIMKLYPSVHGVLYDLPHVQISAQSYVSQCGFDQQVVFTSGSFFDQIPSGSDLYILKRILHDWDDELCVKILSNCRNAMTQNTKLLIIEAIVADDNSRDFAKDVDIAMLVLFGGKERTQNEWTALLEAANLELIKVHKTPSMLSIIEIGIVK